MTHFPENQNKLFPLFLNPRKQRLFDIDPDERVRPHMLAEANDNLRLKSFLKRAVEKEQAPERLINSIKIGIRR